MSQPPLNKFNLNDNNEINYNNRLSKLMNQMKAHGNTINNRKVVDKILMSLIQKRQVSGFNFSLKHIGFKFKHIRFEFKAY